MRNENKNRALAAVALVLLGTSGVRAQPVDVSASATADRDAVTLSEPVRVALTLEGPAPLRVNLPEPLLTADANEVWRVRADGPPAVTPLPGGRARWRRVYRLDPWTPPELLGQQQRITFSPVTVNDRPVAWPAVAVTVERTGGKAAPPLPEPRPVTAVEDLPPLDVVPSRESRAWVLPAVAGVLVGAALVVAVLRLRRARPVPPGEWARAALASVGTGPAAVERVAAVLRTFVERRFNLPATTLTTTELLAAAGQQGWPVEEAEPLRALLDECDRVKFAGDAPDDDGLRRLVAAAVQWVDDVGRAAGPR